MAEYIFTDGPLAGQAVQLGTAHSYGEVISIGVVDVLDSAADDDDAVSFDYYVDREARGAEPGGLRYAMIRISSALSAELEPSTAA